MRTTGHKLEIRDAVLCKIDALTGSTVATHHPIGTSVVQCLAIGSNVIVREDHFQFPRGVSNVYCLDWSFQKLWDAELPSETDVYANPIAEVGSNLVCASWDGDTCTLSQTTGKILKKVFTK
jgi:outer membrane protein assembly factor BamB